MAKKQTKYHDFFYDDEEGECPPMKPAMVRASEKSLGSHNAFKGGGASFAELVIAAPEPGHSQAASV
jgi:hypothetical protein